MYGVIDISKITLFFLHGSSEDYNQTSS